MFKNILAFLILISINAHSQNYTPVDPGSKVHFIIKNFGINTGGDFSGLKGRIVFSPENPADSKFEVTVSASTIDTDNQMRDKNLASDEYFDAAKFPLIKMVSSKISKTNKTADGFYFFTGELTIKGVTRSISFPFQVKKINGDYLFTGNFDIDRTDFGVGEKNIVLSNKVSVSLSVTAKKD
ncbi:MAG TPA: YceI family protein [Hanamia sp.]|jgi:polyisoprenoid-binding protein YceI|nr:YceI family protein [Hanamia sp.]